MADEESHDTTHVEVEHERKKSRKKKKKHHHHRHHHKKEYVANYEIPGVVHVILNDEVQKILHAIVGDNVTAESPWKYVSKDFIQEQVESEEPSPDFQPFVPYKEEIVAYPGDEMFIGYIPDESREYDEFYFCLTPEAVEGVTEIIKKLEEFQQARLNNTINKVVHPWKTLGSEEEVDENILKTTRGFYKVEFETIYPILNVNSQFKFRLVEDAKDGYIELTVPQRYAISNVNKRRINNSVQVAPTVRTTEAQTFCPYPTNAWTQYEYDCHFVEHISKEFMAGFNEFAEDNMDEMCDIFYVNSNINFYTNDYMDLIKNDKLKYGKVTALNTEYMSFKDIKRCKDKMISAGCWHPMWTGVVALAYANISPRWVKTNASSGNEYMHEIVHGYNPVLIWSFNDGLSPKLILETISEVHSLSFCPHDENLLIGGCANGQIILWDIKNKLNKVEEEEIITPAQQKYRLYMFSLMKWMKNTKNISIVPPTATSELMFSHLHNVSSIFWINSFYEMTKTGHFEQDTKDESTLQFATSSADGTIKYWDLKQKPVLVAGDYKPQRKSRRLAIRPSALTMDVSPYRILHRKLRPHYQINIVLPKSNTNCPLAFVKMPPTNIIYEEAFPVVNRVFNIADRIIYKPILKPPQLPPEQEFTAGSYLGDFLQGTWEGYEYLSGEVVSQEPGKLNSFARYHDGPITCIENHPLLEDVCLSVGGKVFAIWKDSLKGKPIMWRRSKHRYTYGHWSIYKPSGVRLNLSNGNRELWNMDSRSDLFHQTMPYSGKGLLEGLPHPRKLEKNVIGLADDKGSFRLVYVSSTVINEKAELEIFKNMTDNNAQRKMEFELWQESWTDKHASWIKQQKEEAIAEAQRKKEEEAEAKLKEEEQKAFEAAEAAKRAAAKLKPPPGHYEEWAHEQWIVKEQDRMGNVLLSKKRLDRETLIKQQAPLKKIEVEEERKKHRQKQRLQKSQQIFDETIAMLFPDLVESKIPKEPEEGAATEEELQEIKQNYFSAYDEIKEESDQFIEENPFIYKFNWKEIVLNGMNRVKNLEFQNNLTHRTRHENSKARREDEIQEVSEKESNVDEQELRTESEIFESLYAAVEDDEEVDYDNN